jgi:hypothetical protein
MLPDTPVSPNTDPLFSDRTKKEKEKEIKRKEVKRKKKERKEKKKASAITGETHITGFPIHAIR